MKKDPENGSAVIWQGGVWRVLGAVDAVGGVRQVHLESLDRDHCANAPRPELVDAGLTAEEIEKRVADRDIRMAPVRAENKRRLLRKSIQRAQDAKNPEKVAYLEKQLAAMGGDS